MSYNVMNEYSKITIKQLNEYMKLILDSKYNKSICDEFTNVYINIRYNGLLEARRGITVRNTLLVSLKEKKDSLLEKMPDKQKNIEYTYLFFDDCAYFDTAEKNENLENQVENIMNYRSEYLEKDETEEEKRNFKIELKKIIKENIKEKDDFLNKFNTNEFQLKVKNYNDNVQKVELEYNIKFSMIYSMEAIEKAFNTGLINEDKVFVQYYMLAAKVIRDIEDSNYRKEYVVDIQNEFFEKEQKIERLLEIINNPILQDRIIIRVNYEISKKYRKEIYEMISKGYKIAVKIDETFENDIAEIQRLAVYKYIIIDEKKEQNWLKKQLDEEKIIIE